ncbi:SET [Seminavis robusta]|uniref:SET n=1 Tax=Seminavis robusta TaxID=568900 RepID=A0A9N8DZ71_9STRA|nr:SET [Seminavis robusta]|eukprot:Sro487_g152910.1 SET (508) ;mRNA; f:38191-39714
MKTLEDLLDAADALAASSQETPARPDFAIPDEFLLAKQQLLEQKETSDGKGTGWFARQDIPAGSLLMAAKPLAMVMLWQEEEEEEENEPDEMEEEDEEDDTSMMRTEKSTLNSMLVVELLQAIQKNPDIWNNSLSTLYPRNEADMANLPIRECANPKLKLQQETLLQQLATAQPQLAATSDTIGKRLPLIVRYNVLSIETCPELLSHPGPGGHANLGGAGLYHWPSFFNHNSERPTVARWAIGDVMCFVAIRDMEAGTEACISYLEHDVLCESAYRRNLLLQMDFQEDTAKANNTDDAQENDEENGPDAPVVDSELQNELMETNAFERLDTIEQLLLQAKGMPPPDDDENDDDDNNNNNDKAMVVSEDEEEESGGGCWFQCDIQNLNILKAITLDGLGQTTKALQVWEECVEFAESKLPPLDESSVVVRVQAALCALHLGDTKTAQQHANKALETHDKLFLGGGAARLRRRFRKDLELCLRKPNGKQQQQQSPKQVADILWPIAPGR